MECHENNEVKRVSPFSYFKENLPLLIIIFFGMLIVGKIWWVWGGIYLLFSITALLLYMKFVCLYCFCYKTQSCHDGYHIIAKRLFKPGKGKSFYRQFKRYVPVVYPIWFLPVPAAIYVLITQFSRLFFGYVIIFSIFGFIILPLMSKNQCTRCKNGPNCPRVVKINPGKDHGTVRVKSTPGEKSTFQ